MRAIQVYARGHAFCCCNTTQTETLVVLLAAVALTSLLWHKAIWRPIKLVAVFLHEFSHAAATWLTCGSVSSIEVDDNFGGVTRSRGGRRWIILSAGYTGSVVFGCIFVLLTYGRVGTRIAAVFFLIACLSTASLLTIKERPDLSRATKCGRSLLYRVQVLLMGLVPLAFWLFEDYVAHNWKVSPLRWCMVGFGTVCVFHAVWDCIQDVLCAKGSSGNVYDGGQKSDAAMFAEEICGTPRLWGTIWTLVSILAAFVSALAVVMLASRCEAAP